MLIEVDKNELAARLEALESESVALRASAADLERCLKEEKEKSALLAEKLEKSEKETLVSKNSCERLEEEIARLKDEKPSFLETQKVKKERYLSSGSLCSAMPLPELELGCRRKEDSVARGCNGSVLGGIIEISDDEDEVNLDSIAQKSFEKDTENVGAMEDEDCSSSKEPLSTFTHKRKGISTVVSSVSKREGDTDKMMRIDGKNVGSVEDDDDATCSKNLPSAFTPKRKCLSRIVTSDSEEEDDDDEDDKVPLSKLKLGNAVDEAKADEGAKSSSDDISFSYNDIQQNVTPSRKCLVALRECGKTKDGARATSPRDSTPQNFSPNTTDKAISRNAVRACRRLVFSGTVSAEEDEVDGGQMVDVETESEGESLGGFIVDDSDGLESGSCSNNAFEEKEQSDGDSDLDDVLAKLRRGKNTEEWEYEADMLSSFFEYPEICMKAVCALYRRQTCEEQLAKGTLVNNKRGFSTFDATKGSLMAEFLMNGDSYSPLKKTVQELHEYDPHGLEYCFKLATHYSKQLFMIYQNKEDPFFLPS